MEYFLDFEKKDKKDTENQQTGPENDEQNPAIINEKKFKEMRKAFIPSDKWEYTGLDTHIEKIVEGELAKHKLTEYKPFKNVEWEIDNKFNKL